MQGKPRTRRQRFLGRSPEQWIEDMGSEDAETRAKAAEVMGWLGEQGIPPLLEALNDRQPTARKAAVNALRSIGLPALPALIEKLPRARRRQRAAIIAVVQSLGAAAVPALLAGIDARSEASIEEALAAIGPAAVPSLIEALEAKKNPARNLIEAAINRAGPAAAEPLLAILASGSRQERQRALDALVALGGRGLPSVMEAAREGSNDQRRAAFLALGHLAPGTAEYSGAIAEALEDPDPGIRSLAAFAIAAIGSAAVDVAPRLVQALEHCPAAARFWIARAIRRFDHPDPQLRPTLEAQLQDQSPANNAAFAVALATGFPIRAAWLLPLAKAAALGAQRNPELARLSKPLTDLAIELPRKVALRFREELRALAREARDLLLEAPEEFIPELIALLPRTRGRQQSSLKEIITQAGPRAVPALLDSLRGSRVTLRKIAADLLAGLGENALPPILEALRSDDPELRERALMALGKLGPDAIPALLQALLDKQDTVRRTAAAALKDLADEIQTPHAPELIQGLKDSDPKTRKILVSILARLGRDALPALEDGLRDRHPRIRLGAAFVLRKIDDSGRTALQAFLDAVDDKRWYIRRSALSAIARLEQRARPAAEKLCELLHERDARIRLAAAEALAAIAASQAPRAIPILLEAFQHASIRSQAAEALAKIGAPALPQIMELLDNRALRFDALDLLWTIGLQLIPSLKPLFIDDLDSESRDRLTGFLQPQALQQLLLALDDKDPGTRAFAAWAIAGFPADSSKALPPLIEILGDPESEVAAAAIKTLQRLGEPAIPFLVQALKRPEDAIREHAIALLGRIPCRSPAAASALADRLRAPECNAAEAAAIGETLGGLIRQLSSQAEPDPRADLVQQLIALTDDGRARIRRAATRALSACGPIACPGLLKGLTERPPPSQQRRLEALRAIAGQAEQSLVQQLALPEHRRAAALALGLGEGEGPEASRPIANPAPILEALLAALEDPEDRIWATLALKRLPANAVPALLAQLTGGEERPRAAAAIAIAERSAALGAIAAPVLIKTLRQGPQEMRKLAARSIAAISERGLNEELRLGLTALARDPKPALRRWAFTALQRRPEPLLPLINQALQDAHPAVRQSAALALRRLQRCPDASRDALRALLADDDAEARWRAASVLGDLFAAGAATADPLTLEGLTARLDDAHNRVAGAAAAALSRAGAPALDALQAKLEHPSAGARRWTVWACGALAAALSGEALHRAIALLTAALDDPQSAVAEAAARALAALGPAARGALPALRAALGKSQQGLHSAAIQALAQIGGEAAEAADELTVFLAGDNEELEQEAAIALAQITAQSDEAILPILVQALEANPHTTDQRPRRALEALETIGLKAVPLLFEALKKRHPGSRRGAAIILARVSPLAVHAVIPVLVETLEDNSEELAARAARALGAFGAEAAAALPALENASETGAERLRAAALQGLAQIAAPAEALPALLRALGDADPEVRAAAAAGLARPQTDAEQSRRAIAALCPVLDDPDERARAAASAALAALAPRSTDAVIAALADLEGPRARAAADAVIAIGPPAVPQLLSALRGDHLWIRLRAAELLTRIWPVSQSAVPAILDALASDDIWTRQNAITLIKDTEARLAQNAEGLES